MPDTRNKHIQIGDTVSAALREGNGAALRVGRVVGVRWDHEPNVENSKDTEEEEVVLVLWQVSTTGYIPKKPTSMSARKVYRHDRA